MIRSFFALMVMVLVTPVLAADAPEAAMDADIRQREGFEAMIAGSQAHIASVNENPELRGSGPYPARMEVDLAWPNATLYRPADFSRLGQRKLGIVIWGNGGCRDDGASAWRHLAEIASHGYLVIAPGKPLSGPLALPGAALGTHMSTTVQDMRSTLDWVLAENGRTGSPFYHLIDPDMVAAAGHSCGAMQAMILADDPRVATLLVHNSSLMPVLPDNPPLVMHEERLRGIHVPTLMLIGGKDDVVWRFSVDTFEKLTGAPVFFGSQDNGHEGTFDQPKGGENARVAVAWLEWTLRGDTQAGRTFIGEDCRLCQDSSWLVRKKRLP